MDSKSAPFARRCVAKAWRNVCGEIPFGSRPLTNAKSLINKKNGKFKEYYNNGKLQSTGEYMFNKMNGEWTFYTKNGSVDKDKSGNYMNNKKSKF